MARAQAEPPAVRADVDAVVSADLSRLHGHARLTVRAPAGSALEHVDVWAFPERLATPPHAMDEVDEPRLFPVGFQPAAMDLGGAVDGQGRALRIERIETTLYRIHLVEPVAAGEVAVVVLTFETRIPRRFGPFGRDAGQLTLDGGFFPRPPPLDAAGFHPDLPPDALDFHLSLGWAGRRDALSVVNGRLTELTAGGEPQPVGEGRARRVSLLLYTRHQISRLVTDHGRVMLVHRRKRRGTRGPDDLFDLGVIDVHAQTLATVGATLGFLARHGVAVPDMTVCAEAPLRRALARTAPGMILVSDRAFDVTPYEPIRKFHRLPLVRATAALVVEDIVAPQAEPGRADQAVDLVAVDLTERWERAMYGGQEGARELLAKGSLLAEVDDALTAPQIPFESAFFRGPDDTDRFRDSIELFSHRRPVGHLWREKLVDRLGAEAAGALAADVARGVPLPEALSRHGDGVDMAWLEAWDEGTPDRNYAIDEVTRGEDDEGPFVDVQIRVDGPVQPPEQVAVRVEGRRRAPAQASVVVDQATVTARVRSTATRPRVVLDPKRRLAESDLGRPVDPRADNLTHPRWRVLLDGFGLSLNSASGRADVIVSGFVRREADIDHTFLLSVFDLERRTGVAVDWLRSLGPKVVPNRRRLAIGVGTSISWLKPRRGDGSGLGLRLRFTLGELTFRSRTDPRAGVARLLAIGPTLATRDGTSDIGFAGSALLGRLIPIGGRHTLAGAFRADILLGEISSSETLGIGGPGGVRALATFARTGEMRLAGSLEWRHRYTRDVSISALHLAFVHGIDGVLFVDGALLGQTPNRTFQSEAFSVGIGYGLRFHYVVAGLTPMVFSIDAAVPLLVAGQRPRGVPPVTVGAAVGQSF
ncbi:MAG: hypothetical protein R3F39_20880 [Myxococcota bacterium]